MAEKNSAQTNRQTDRRYENNGHLAVNQYKLWMDMDTVPIRQLIINTRQLNYRSDSE